MLPDQRPPDCATAYVGTNFQLISRRLLDALDHKDVDRSLGRVQLDAELLAQRGEQIRRVGIDGARWFPQAGRAAGRERTTA